MLTCKIDNWQIEIPSSVLHSTRPFIGTLNPSLSSSFQKFRQQKVVMSNPYLQSTIFGYTLQQSQILSLLSLQYTVSSSILVTDPCNAQQQIMVLQSSQSIDYYSSLLLVTSDNFATSRLFDITRSLSGDRYLAGSICETLTELQCKLLVISKAVLTRGNLFLVTSAGLFYTQQLAGLKDVNQPSLWTQLLIQKSTTAALLAPTLCLQNTDITLQVLTSQSSYTLSAFVLDSSTFAMKYTQPLSQLIPTGFSIITTQQNTQTTTTLVLIGIQLQSNCTDCTYSNVSLLRLSGTLPPLITESFKFPSQFICSSLHLHADHQSLIAFGSQVYISNDDGLDFTLIALPTPLVFINRIVSTQILLNYALQSTSNQIFIGRIQSTQVVMLEHKLPPLSSLTYDQLGNLIMLRVDGSTPTSSSQYPVGIFQDSVGTPRTDIIKVTRLPIFAYLKAFDASFETPLVPIFISSTEVYFFAYSTTKMFSMEMIESQVAHNNGGSAHIRSVSTQLTTSVVLVQSPFQYENALTSPSIAYPLTILLSMTPALQLITLEFTPSLVPATLTLTLPALANGWLLSDINKTIVFNLGSIILTTYVSNTVILGLLVKPPNFYQNTYINWKLYDFRGYEEFAATNSQSISLAPSTSGTSLVTLSAGIMTFSTKRNINLKWLCEMLVWCLPPLLDLGTFITRQLLDHSLCLKLHHSRNRITHLDHGALQSQILRMDTFKASQDGLLFFYNDWLNL